MRVHIPSSPAASAARSQDMPRCLSEAMCCDAHRGSNGHLVEGWAIHGSLAKQHEATWFRNVSNTNGWDRWRPMETDGDRWRPMETDGDRWRPMETDGDRWRPMETDGDRWDRGIVGIPWVRQWMPVDASVHLMSWWCDSSLSHVLIWQCRKHVFKPVAFSGILQKFMTKRTKRDKRALFFSHSTRITSPQSIPVRTRMVSSLDCWDPLGSVWSVAWISVIWLLIWIWCGSNEIKGSNAEHGHNDQRSMTPVICHTQHSWKC